MIFIIYGFILEIQIELNKNMEREMNNLTNKYAITEALLNNNIYSMNTDILYSMIIWDL